MPACHNAVPRKLRLNHCRRLVWRLRAPLQECTLRGGTKSFSRSVRIEDDAARQGGLLGPVARNELVAGKGKDRGFKSQMSQGAFAGAQCAGFHKEDMGGNVRAAKVNAHS